MRRLIMITLIMSVLFLSACQSDSETASSMQMGKDIREETSSIEVLPTFLSSKSEDIQLIYQIAAHQRDLLQQIPCYCGCGEAVGHKSNADCFIHAVKDDRTVVWDDHGTKCGVCLEIAVKSAQMAEDGADVQEIRQEINRQYEKGYAKPTPTPLR